MGAHPPYRPLSQQGLLDTIMLVYDLHYWKASS